MSWGYSEPMRCDFDSDDDFSAAKDAYELMEDLYAEEYLERKRGIN